MTLLDYLALAGLTALLVWVIRWAWKQGNDTDDGSGDDPGPY